MLSERCSHSLIYINNKIINNEIFAIGGYNNNTCERYSINNNKWNWLPKLNENERQVSTLFIYNENELFILFGFMNQNNENYVERLNLEKLNFWKKIEIKVNSDKILLDKFNVGIIPLDSIKGNYLFIGGESCKKGECNDVYNVSFVKNDKNEFVQIDYVIIVFYLFLILLLIRNLLKIKEGKYTQFEMKKNNLIFYNFKKNKI